MRIKNVLEIISKEVCDGDFSEKDEKVSELMAIMDWNYNESEVHDYTDGPTVEGSYYGALVKGDVNIGWGVVVSDKGDEVKVVTDFGNVVVMEKESGEFSDNFSVFAWMTTEQMRKRCLRHFINVAYNIQLFVDLEEDNGDDE